MDITPKLMIDSQRTRHMHYLLHRVVGIPNDSGAEKQTFDIISPIKIQGELNDFFRCKSRPLHAARPSIDTVETIVDAKIRQQYLQQRNTTAVWRVAVTNPRSGCGPDASGAGIAARRAAARTRSVVFRGIRKNSEFRSQIH